MVRLAEEYWTNVEAIRKNVLIAKDSDLFISHTSMVADETYDEVLNNILQVGINSIMNSDDIKGDK